MAEIARFFGIVIVTYSEKSNKHHCPHIHARYGEFSAVFNIETGDVLVGHLPAKQEKLVSAWCVLRREELIKCWNSVSEGENPQKVAPLK